MFKAMDVIWDWNLISAKKNYLTYLSHGPSVRLCLCSQLPLPLRKPWALNLTLSPTTVWVMPTTVHCVHSVHSAWLLQWLSVNCVFLCNWILQREPHAAFSHKLLIAADSPFHRNIHKRGEDIIRLVLRFRSPLCGCEKREIEGRIRGVIKNRRNLFKIVAIERKNFPGSLLGPQTLHLNFVSFFPLKKNSPNWRYLLILFVWV